MRVRTTIKAETTWLVVSVEEQISVVATPEHYLGDFSLKYRNGPSFNLKQTMISPERYIEKLYTVQIGTSL